MHCAAGPWGLSGGADMYAPGLLGPGQPGAARSIHMGFLKKRGAIKGDGLTVFVNPVLRGACTWGEVERRDQG